jgi:hypothetical protein
VSTEITAIDIVLLIMIVVSHLFRVLEHFIEIQDQEIRDKIRYEKLKTNKVDNKPYQPLITKPESKVRIWS